MNTNQSPNQLTFSVVIPAYNEEKRIVRTLDEAHSFLVGKGKSFEIIVVSDGSSDDTKAVVVNYSKQAPEVRLLQLAQNRGKGYAVKRGVLEARGELVLFCDADGSTPFAEFDKLEAALQQGVDIVIGSRALRSEDSQVQTVWYRKFMGRVFNSLVNLLIVPGIADTQCGFKLFRHEVAVRVFSLLTAERFSFDVELLFLARKCGFSIREIAVNWYNVPGSKVNLIKDSFSMFVDILRFRVNYLLGRYGL